MPMFSAVLRYAVAGLFILLGLLLGAGGARLVTLDGSPYYLIAGVVLFAAGLLALRRSGYARLLYAIFLIATLVWALVEVGFQFWALLPRLAGPAVLALLLALPFVGRAIGGPRARLGSWAVFGAGLAALLALGGSYLASGPALGDPAYSDTPRLMAATDSDTEWTAYGRDAAGTRHSPAALITPANVASMTEAWRYRTGDSNAARPDIAQPMSFMVTPLMVDDLLVFCTPIGAVVALNPDSGRQVWRHDPKSEFGAAQMLNCRGVSVHRASVDGTGARETGGLCASRVLSTAVDGRLLALDLRTGRPCPGFGDNGTVSLLDGLGEFDEGATYTTSPPVIIGDTAVLGGYVRDNFKTNDPSGVVRAFDVTTGRMLWAWDSGRPDDAPPLAEGETYTPASPNAWSVLSADPELGLVYVPTGNATPDHVGMHRSAELERYASSVVALDAATGRVRWHFQTTRHDLWDYDVPAQPVLFDMPTASGMVPAVAVPTKRGEIFILDRRDGTPLTGIEERPAPQGNVPGERYAATQPYQTGFPSLIPAALREADMWGATPIDQLWCRIRYRSLDYRGDFTPPSTRGALQYPGIFGMLNWGSVSVDAARGLMVVNSSAIPQVVTLHDRAAMAGQEAGNAHTAGMLPQEGTPYALTMEPMVSPLGIPCTTPPWGQLTAIDLADRTVAWQRPLGTSEDIAPMGIAVPGIFNLGGPVTTGGGVTLIAATLDDYLRAFDTRTGQELWRGRLPAGGQATPMTFVSPRSGRQFVVIAAGGHGFLGSTPGDYLMAFALPDGAAQDAPTSR
ncbi:MAG: quinoprotein glucose dehydrogenase [Croceicoccus sp.]|nr:quinoprotein glucose dehydrogenase [Croceicoccus sp.]MAL25079.1 quinoprotein glucose dehydrogenase [Croceicoccus sp.]